MDIRPIRNDEDHRAALVEIERLWAFPDDGPENDKLDVLATLVEDYERRRWLREACSPTEVLRYAIDEMGHTQADLAAIVGKTLASQFLKGARRISLGAAQKISAAWAIPIQLLVAPYETEPSEGSRRPGAKLREPRRRGASGKAEAA